MCWINIVMLQNDISILNPQPTAHVTVLPREYNGAKTFLLPSDLVALVMTKHSVE